MSINESRIAEKTVASEAVPFNRWVVVVGGIIVQLCLGAIYAWSAFTKALMADPYAFTKTQTQIIFAGGLVSFAVVMAIIAGRWQTKVGPIRRTDHTFSEACNNQGRMNKPPNSLFIEEFTQQHYK